MAGSSRRTPDAIPMEDLGVELPGSFGSARSQKLGQDLETESAEGRTKFTLPGLGTYDGVVLE